MTNKKRLIIFTGIYFVVLLFGVIYFTRNLIEKIAITSFKKLFSTYNQALLLTVNDMDDNIGCYFSADKNYPSDFSKCDKFYKIFSTNLKVTKYCKDKSFEKGCLPIYKNYAVTPSCAGFSENMMNRYNQTFVMNDNSLISIFNLPQNIQNPIFAVDSNGKLFPNKAGHDLFSLVIMRRPNGNYHFHSNVTYCLPQEKGGIQKLQDAYN